MDSVWQRKYGQAFFRGHTGEQILLYNVAILPYAWRATSFARVRKVTLEMSDPAFCSLVRFWVAN